MQHASLRQFVRFCISGVLSASVEIVSLIFLVEVMGIHKLIANALAFVLANVLNYFLSRQWVFGMSGRKQGIEASYFLIFGTIGLLINESIFFVASHWLLIPYVLSKLMAIAITVAWNFFTKKYFVFGRIGLQNAERR